MDDPYVYIQVHGFILYGSECFFERERERERRERERADGSSVI